MGINKYQFYWIRLEAVEGKVRKDDYTKIARVHPIGIIGKQVTFIPMGDKGRTIAHIESIKGKLHKDYRITMFTDAQWGIDGGKSLTTKQINETFIIH